MTAERWAELDPDGVVVSIALADSAVAAGRGWIGPVVDDVGPGWTYVGGRWTPGDPPLVDAPSDPVAALQSQVDTLTAALAQATTLSMVRKAAQQAQSA